MFLFFQDFFFAAAVAAARPRQRPIQAMEMKKFSGVLPLKKIFLKVFFCRGSGRGAAAATTHLSDGNENVFTNFITEK